MQKSTILFDFAPEMPATEERQYEVATGLDGVNDDRVNQTIRFLLTGLLVPCGFAYLREQLTTIAGYETSKSRCGASL
jgi:hypothetical protein